MVTVQNNVMLPRHMTMSAACHDVSHLVIPETNKTAWLNPSVQGNGSKHCGRGSFAQSSEHCFERVVLTCMSVMMSSAPA